MQDILIHLEKDITESLEQTNLNEIFEKLNQIKSPIICSGVGGSMPCAVFASKIFQEKNYISYTLELLEILQNPNQKLPILLFSHSGKNYGIKKVIKNKENTYLMTTRKSKIDKEITLKYQENKKEKSFISIKSTLISMSILLMYTKRELKFPKQIRYNIPEFQTIEILKDANTKTAATYLESTFIEANIAPVIVHDKYSFCHGRTTSTYYQDNLIIYLISKKTALDENLLNALQKYQKKIIILDVNEQDPVLADFELTIQGLTLLIQIAEQKKIDLCNINYAPFASELYHNQLGEF